MKGTVKRRTLVNLLIALSDWWGGDIPSILFFGEYAYPEQEVSTD